jgi:poly-gamma-glutamate capsule biosynthesis protein CapA/YwtB (metallophosphatase superfamily)
MTFHFRAPPSAVEALANLGVDCVTLANNHALDFGPDGLPDTFSQLALGEIAWVGAGPEVASARAPVGLEAGGFRLGILALTDHPSDYAAAATQPGVAYANLARGGVPGWVADAIAALEADAILVTPHWGWNMTTEPVADVLAAARGLLETGATLVVGHSAHLFHGIALRVLFDLGDFLDDYRVDRQLRNDLGVLFLVDLANSRLEAIPLKLEFAHPASPTVKTTPGSGVASATPARRSRRP